MIINPYFFGGLRPISSLLADIVAIRGTATRTNVNNYFADAFFDETGIDLSASSNELYNATDDYYEGTVTDTTSASVPTENTAPSAFANNTVRIVISGSAISTSGSTCKITVQSYSAASMTINEMWIQEQASSGDAYDFSTTPVQVLWSGGSSVVVPANAEATSDTVNFAIDETKNYVISLYAPAGTSLGQVSGAQPGFAVYFKAGNDASTVNATGYSLFTAGNGVPAFRFLIVSNRNNLDLITNSYTSPTVPARANIVAVYNPITAITLNTDLIARVTRDNGATYTDIPLTSGGASGISGYVYAYGEVDVSAQPSGINMRYRLLTQNNKNIRDASIAGSYY